MNKRYSKMTREEKKVFLEFCLSKINWFKSFSYINPLEQYEEKIKKIYINL